MAKVQVFIFPLLILLHSCGKHVYAYKDKDVHRYSSRAKEAGLDAFVAYANGDTIKGHALKRKSNPFNTKDKWVMDKKTIAASGVISFQNRYGFATVGGYLRLWKGNHSQLFMFQKSVPGPMKRLPDGSSTSSTTTYTTFHYATRDENLTINSSCITINSLKKIVNDCPLALNQIDKEFHNTVWAKHPDGDLRDYKAIIRILEIFNNNCEQ